MITSHARRLLAVLTFWFTLSAVGFAASVVTSFTPTSGVVGTSVVLTGTGFTGSTGVNFNGTIAGSGSFTINSDTQITLPVPTGATTGTITVINGTGNGVSATSFTVLPARSLVVGSLFTTVGVGESALLQSFTIEGSAAKQVLVRAVGPELGSAPFNVAGALVDPVLAIHNATGAVEASNNDWGTNANAAAITSTTSAVGAFPLTAGSKTSALLVSLAPGTYTARVTGAGATTGTALLEVYDTDTVGRLPYLSARAFVAGGSNFRLGFTLTGTAPQNLIIRALGASSLAGVAGALVNPTLTVFNNANVAIATNDDWGTSASSPIKASSAADAGLKPLADSSADAALNLVGLVAGNYTIQVLGVGATSGLVQVEVAQYDPQRAATAVPALLAPLLPQIVAAGATNVTLSAAPYLAKPVTGLTFQWKKTVASITTDIGGSTAQILVLPTFAAGDAADYSVAITTSAGTTTTAPATLTLATAPAITSQPLAQTAAAGDNVTLTAAASGNPAPSYQWLLNGRAIAGATTAVYTITGAQLANSGLYSVTATNSIGSVTSSAVLLKGPNPLPVIATQPVNVTFVAGTTGPSLSVAATGTGVLTYQWRKFGVPVAGATAATLTLSSASLADAGLYDVQIADGLSLTTSSVARLDVRPAAYPSGPLRPRSGFAPVFELAGSSRAIVTVPGGAFYAVGGFTSVNGVAQTSVARFLADGTVDPAFNAVPLISGTVNAAVIQGTGASAKLIIGGSFRRIGGVVRDFLARLDATTGAFDVTFTPSVGASVNALALQADGKLVVGSDNGGLARFDGTAGATDATLTTGSGFGGGQILALALDSSSPQRIVVGGSFSSYNGVATNVGRLARLSSTGVLDTTFGAAVGTSLNNNVNALAIYPGAPGTGNNGKIVVGGVFNGTTRSRLTRLNNDGTVDSGFMSVGAGFDNNVHAVAIQPDGKVLVVGTFFSLLGSTSVSRGGFARLDATTGAVDTFYPTGGSQSVRAVAVDDSGRVLIGGDFSSVGSTARLGIARLNSADGSIESGVTAALRQPGTVNAVVQLPGGDYIVGGFFNWHGNTPGGRTAVNHLARISSVDGSLNTAFNTAVGSPGLNSSVDALALDGNGQIVVGGGFGFVNGVAVNRVARFSPTGVRDAAFLPPSAINNLVSTLAVQADGNIVVGGQFSGTTNANRIARLTPTTGALDAAFLSGAGFDNAVNTLAIQPDGQILVGGLFTTYSGTSAVNRIARLTSTGALDTAFTTAAGTAASSTVRALNLQLDGKILVGGDFGLFNGVGRANLVRLNANGSADSAFLSGLTGPNASVSALETQGTTTAVDGKIVIAGNFSAVSGANILNYARLGAADGVRDATLSVPSLQFGIPGFPKHLSYAANGTLLVGGTRLEFAERSVAGLVVLEAAPVVSIDTQPTNQTAALNSAVSFTVAASGSPSTYQWLKNGTAIVGATSATYNIASAQISDVGSYTVQVSNLYSTVTSNAVTLSGSAAVPTITTQPVNTTAVAGTAGTLSVAATGSALTYQWRKFGVPVAGATAATLALSSASLADQGLYDVQIADGLTVTTSAAARLDVRPAAFPVGILRPRPGFAPVFEINGTTNAVVPAPGGAFYALGNFTTIDGVARTGVARFLASGAIDPSFNASQITGQIRAAVLQGSGASAKLIIGGDFRNVAGVRRDFLARLDAATGAFDATFTPSVFGTVTSLALQNDGKVVAGGFSFVTRFDGTTGATDTTFSTGTGFNASVLAVALDNSSPQRIIVGGTFTSYNGVTTNVNRLARLSSTGVLDTAFGAAANTAFGTSLNAAGSSINAIAVHPGTAGTGNGAKIVLGGVFTGTTRSYLTRLNDGGTLDTAFMAIGTGFNNSVSAITLQPDGSVLAGGIFTSINGGVSTATTTTRNRFARLDATTGVVDSFYPAAGFDNGVIALAFATDGKLIAGGFFGSAGVSARLGLARFDGTSGVVETAPAAALRAPATLNAVVPVTGGRYVVAGNFTWLNQTAVNRLVRIDAATGALDTTFETNLGTGPNGDPRALAVQGDGRLLVGGFFNSFSGATRSGLAQLSSEGVLDTTFVPASAINSVQAITLQPDGLVVVGGNFSGTTHANRIARLTATGALDASFATGTGFDSTVNALALQPDGKIVAGGQFTAFSGTAAVNRIARLNVNGSLDTAFTTAAGTAFNNTVQALNLQADGKILVGGDFTVFNATTRNNLARLGTTGALDATFLGTLSGPNGGAYALATQGTPTSGDGKVAIVGNFNSVSGTSSLNFARLGATDGVRDATFSVPTIQLGVFVGARVLFYAGDGALLVGGNRFDFTERTAAGLVALEAAPVISITTQPTDQAGTIGGSVTFTVASAGEAPVYQWFKNGVAISGQTAATLTLSNVQIADVANYTVSVSNLYNSVTSPAATITGGAAAAITAQPVAASAIAGGNVTLSVTATGATSYQWRRNGVALPGETASTFAITGARQTDSDTYDVVVYAGLTPTVSAPARVTVSPTAFPNGLRPDDAFNLALSTPILGPGSIRAVVRSGTQFYVAGDFIHIGGQPRSRVARFNIDGTLDTAFVPPVFDGAIRALAVQADGKLIVGGDFNSAGGVSTSRVARLNTDGVLDPSFVGYNTNGVVFALAVQTDGKILVGGNSSQVGGIPRAALARLNADGTPDLAYNAQLAGGTVVNALLLLGDGRLVVGGTFTTVAGVTRGNVAILTTSGALDPTFAPIVPAAPAVAGFAGGAVNALALDSTDKLLVGGAFNTFSGTAQNRLARLNLDGTLDSSLVIGTGLGNAVSVIQPLAGGSFVVGGSFTTYNAISRSGLALIGSTGTVDPTFTPSATANTNVLALAVDSAGALVVGGDFTALNGLARNRLGRVNAETGAVDSTLNPAAEFPASVYAVATQPGTGGKILVLSNATRVGGTAIPSGLFRLNANLTLDPSYNMGNAGILFNGGINSGSIVRLLVAPDGKAYVAASMTSYNGTARANLARVSAEGTLDTTFAIGTGFNSTITSMAFAPGGQLLVGGNFNTYNGVTVNGLVRLNSDGSRDASLVAPTASLFGIQVIVPAPGGKIYVGGTFTSISAPTATTRNRLARLNADGSLDTSFDPAGGPNSNVQAITVLDDGRLLVGGFFNFLDGVARNGVARLSSAGVLDRTFGNTTANTSANINALTVQPDGKILQRGNFLGLSIAPVVTGTSTTAVSTFGLARLSANGIPESSISVNNMATLAMDSSVILDDGRVLVGHLNPSLDGSDTLRTGLTLLVPQAGPGRSGALRPIFTTAGTNVSASTVFAGNTTGPVTYQWFKNGSPLVPAVDRLFGSAGRQLVLNSAIASDAGDYYCVVTDDVGSFTTNTFKLVVGASAPVVGLPTVLTSAVSSTASPGVTYTEGTPLALRAAVTAGSAPLTYRWQLNNVDVPSTVTGYNALTLELGTLTAANAGAYTLKVTNAEAPAGVSSAALTLTLANSGSVAPVIVQNPTQQTAVLGSSTTFSVVAAGPGALSYLWKKDGLPLTNPPPSATEATLLIPSTTLADAGVYTVDVTNLTGTTTSAGARLSIGNPSVWSWRQVLPFGGAYAKTAFGAGRYVAVGYAGAISTSTDAITWTLLGQFGSGFTDVVFANNRFVAVGFAGTISTSSDGLNWTRRNLTSTPVVNLTAVLHDGTQYVAAGTRGAIFTSADGATWTPRAAAVLPFSDYLPVEIRGLAFGGGTYIAVTADGIYTTTNLSGPWVRNPLVLVSGGLRAVTFTGSSFIASGSFGTLLRSTDNGVTWTAGGSDSVNFNDVWVSLASNGTRHVAVKEGFGSIATTTDGLKWRIVTNFPVDLQNFNGVNYVNGQFVAVGNGGMIFTSADGLAWTQRSSNPLGLGDFNAVAAGASGFVAVGVNGQIASSPDGQTWTKRDSGSAGALAGVVFGGSKYVAVSNSGVVHSSTNGADWTNVVVAGVNAVAYDGSQYVAVGNGGAIRTSPDALAWALRVNGSATAPALRGVAAGVGALVAVGDTGLITRSSDAGVTWAPATVPTSVGVATTILRAVIFAGGQFVAVGQDQIGQVLSTVIVTSPDGTTWTRRDVPYTQSARAITYTGSRYIVGGGTSSILTSADGITWTSETSNNSQLVFGLANSLAGTVAVGSAGGIQFASNSPAPTVALISPITGASGVTVTLTGTGFTGATGVSFNGVAGTALNVVSDTSATVVTPATFTSGPVTITGPGGTSLATVNYTVFAPPVIATQPAPTTVNQNSSATFTVVATGATPLSYQWKRGTTNVGTNSSTLTITSAQAADVGTYSVVVTNADGSTTSVNATLSVVLIPVINVQPANLTVPNGDAASFSVTTSAGTAPLTYQWRRNGVNITTGGAAATFTLAPATLADTGAVFSVIVSNAAGSVTSSDATLTVLPTRHSADTNADLKISLAELTRVIELYNATVASVRTGEYRTQAGTEDLFAPGPGPITAGFHSADKSNRTDGTSMNGRIDLFELTRVIELYNYRDSAGVRTGEYRPQVGTEDGFAPGP